MPSLRWQCLRLISSSCSPGDSPSLCNVSQSFINEFATLIGQNGARGPEAAKNFAPYGLAYRGSLLVADRHGDNPSRVQVVTSENILEAFLRRGAGFDKVNPQRMSWIRCRGHNPRYTMVAGARCLPCLAYVARSNPACDILGHARPEVALSNSVQSALTAHVSGCGQSMVLAKHPGPQRQWNVQAVSLRTSCIHEAIVRGSIIIKQLGLSLRRATRLKNVLTERILVLENGERRLILPFAIPFAKERRALGREEKGGYGLNHGWALLIWITAGDRHA